MLPSTSLIVPTFPTLRQDRLASRGTRPSRTVIEDRPISRRLPRAPAATAPPEHLPRYFPPAICQVRCWPEPPRRWPANPTVRTSSRRAWISPPRGRQAQSPSFPMQRVRSAPGVPTQSSGTDQRAARRAALASSTGRLRALHSVPRFMSLSSTILAHSCTSGFHLRKRPASALFGRLTLPRSGPRAGSARGRRTP